MDTVLYETVYKKDSKAGVFVADLKTKSLWTKIKYNLPLYKNGLYVVLVLGVDGVLLGFLLSLVLLGVKNKSTPSRKNNVFVKTKKLLGSKLVDFYLWFLKGVPAGTQAMLVFYSSSLWWPAKAARKNEWAWFPKWFPEMSRAYAALIVIVLNSAASIAAVLQNIKFVDKGQVEAA
ncbi:MAG: hypothetical protein ACQBVK_01125 [Candidatus Phytoplasma sp. TWB_XP]